MSGHEARSGTCSSTKTGSGSNMGTEPYAGPDASTSASTAIQTRARVLVSVESEAAASISPGIAQRDCGIASVVGRLLVGGSLLTGWASRLAVALGYSS